MVTPEAAGPVFVLIGGGPRGLNVLERFVTAATRDPARTPCVLHVVDPSGPGAGIHDGPPDYLLLNTIASQLTAFVDDAMIDGGGVTGPSLYEWARAQALTYTSNVGEQRAPRPTDHLPRHVLGRYLTWAARRLRSACPSWLELRFHRCAAIGIQSTAHGRELVYLSSGRTIEADHVTITVGHSGTPPEPAPAQAPAGAWLSVAYPLPSAVDSVAPGETAALLGGGLTAMDVIAACTLGRGGRYAEGADGLTYLPGGGEPRLVLLTRHGSPARARPRPYRQAPPAAVHLTAEGLARLRARRPDGRLDLRADVLPLVFAEMSHRVASMLPAGTDAAAVCEAVLAGWEAPVPAAARTDAAAYAAWCGRQIADDLREARAGLDGSALKYAYEVVRDHREVLRLAVDRPGLTEESLPEFYGPFVAAVNRNVIGPQAERNEELLALARAGILTFGPGPAPRIGHDGDRWVIRSTALDTPATVYADRVVCAFSPAPRVRDSDNPLVYTLLRAGRIRPFRAGGVELGAEVDGAGHPIDLNGESQPRLALLGPLAEGSSYYNHYVTSPGAPSRATAQAHRAVQDAVAIAAAELARHH